MDIVYNVLTMYYTSIQAAQFLGVSKGHIRTLIKAGKLVDHAKTAEGKSKHHIKLNLAELKKYKKENPTPPRSAARQSKQVSITNFPGVGIMTRLDRIESKLDDLIKLWS